MSFDSVAQSKDFQMLDFNVVLDTEAFHQPSTLVKDARKAMDLETREGYESALVVCMFDAESLVFKWSQMPVGFNPYDSPLEYMNIINRRTC